VTIQEWLRQTTGQLKAGEISSAALDAELILSAVTAQDRAWLKAHGPDKLDPDQAATASRLAERRLNREPLVHLTGQRQFYGLDFKITPNVLTPRVETEQMVEWAIKYAPTSTRLIDVGTGSGAIAIAIAAHRPDLAITATDVSVAALKVAAVNAKRHSVDIDWYYSDLWTDVDSTFHTVVTNLPYLRDNADLMPEVKREPAVALFGGADGLDLYRRFLAGVPGHLEPGGYLFTECDPWQQASLIAEAAKVGLRPIEQGYFIVGFQNGGR
jgi:release factor glutamine methyltransferase